MVFVTLGDISISKNEPGEQQIIGYPQLYGGYDQSRLIGDIAVVRLLKKAKLDTHTNVIKLAPLSWQPAIADGEQRWLTVLGFKSSAASSGCKYIFTYRNSRSIFFKD
jgi:hypothetical protein